MNFLEKDLLWLLPAVVLGVMLIWLLADLWRRKSLKKYLPEPEMLVISYPARYLRRGILLIAMLLLAVAAARPVWGERPLEVNIAEHDVMIVFDLSKSMLAEDVAPSRLEHGKYLVRELIKKNPRNNYGIIAFAGRAFPALPLTADRVSLEQCIDEMDCELVPVGGSDIASALAMAGKALKSGGNIRRDIILITDGEELSGNARSVLQQLKDRDIRVVVVAPGNPAVPALIPEKNSNGQQHFKRDRNGELVRTKLNENLLKEIARVSGGVYFNSNTAHSNLAQINAVLNDETASGKRQVKRSLPIERFMIFLILGFAGLVFYMLIPETPLRKRSVSILLGLTVTFLQCDLKAEQPIPPGGRSEAAAVLANTTDPYQRFASARKLQQEKRLEDAAIIYHELLKASVPEPVRSSAMYNLGVMLHQQGQHCFAEAENMTGQNKFDDAAKKISEGNLKLQEAEELYASVMTCAGDNEYLSEISGNAQQQLLLDRGKAEALARKIREYQQQLQRAQSDMQQAAQHIRQAPPPQQQPGDRNQKNQPRDGALQSLQQARQSLESLQKKADDFSGHLSDSVQQSGQYLAEADEKFKKGDRKGAEKAIDKALRHLERSAGKTPEARAESSARQHSAQNPAETPDAEKKQPGTVGQQRENSMDKLQTDALLDMMMQDEQALRNNINRNRGRRIVPVEKDW